VYALTLLVWLVFAIRVTDLSLQVVLLGLDKVANTGKVRPLHISVEVDLDNTIWDSLSEVIDTATTSSVEDQKDGLIFLCVGLLLDVLLVLLEKLGSELDISGLEKWDRKSASVPNTAYIWSTDLVNTVHVTESSSNAEVWRYGGESGVDVVDVFGLCIKRVVVH
jgi:hypothetical protein